MQSGKYDGEARARASERARENVKTYYKMIAEAQTLVHAWAWV